MKTLTDRQVWNRTVAAANQSHAEFDADATLGLRGLSDAEKIAEYKRAAVVVKAQFDRRGRKA